MFKGKDRHVMLLWGLSLGQTFVTDDVGFLNHKDTTEKLWGRL